MFLVGIAFLSAGLIKGTLGLGLPVTVIAILAPFLGLQTAIGLMVVPSIAMNLWQALSGGGFWELTRRLWPLLVMSLVGIWLGVQVLATANADLLLGLLAAVLIVYAILGLTTPSIRPPGRHETFLSPVVGFFGGLVFGIVGNYMVPGVIYLQALGMSRDRLVQALGITFVVISVALLATMSRLELIDRTTLTVSCLAMLPGLVGMAVGQRLRQRLAERQFRQLFFIALIVVGIYMLVKSLFF